MTDVDLVTKKLGEIATYLRELELLGRPDRIEEDLEGSAFPASHLTNGNPGGPRRSLSYRHR